jgi:hypothetical protein
MDQRSFRTIFKVFSKVTLMSCFQLQNKKLLFVAFLNLNVFAIQVDVFLENISFIFYNFKQTFEI